MSREDSISCQYFQGCHLLWNLDRDEASRLIDIESQEETVQISRLVCESSDPVVQRQFADLFVRKANKLDWYIPEPCGSRLQELLRRNESSEMNRTHVRGLIELSLPFKMDFKELVEGYLPNAEYIASPDGNSEYILNNGELVLEITKNGGNISGIFSPLTLNELSALFLWLPMTHRLKLSTLMGLPKPDESDISEYIVKRWEFDSAIPILSNHFSKKSYDPYCKVAQDSEFHLSATIEQAVQGQCSNDPSNIWFPAYGVTSAENIENPILATSGLITCIGLAIYDPISKLSLLGHFTTSILYYGDVLSPPSGPDAVCVYNHSLKGVKEPSQDKFERVLSSAYDYERSRDREYCRQRDYPLEWYVGTFKEIYFPADGQRLKITIIRTSLTYQNAVDAMLESLKLFFPDAAIQIKQPAHRQTIDFQLDSRSGNVTIGTFPEDEIKTTNIHL